MLPPDGRAGPWREKDHPYRRGLSEEVRGDGIRKIHRRAVRYPFSDDPTRRPIRGIGEQGLGQLIEGAYFHTMTPLVLIL